MSWLTTCPKCQTTFRIGFRQLDAHQGMVRCGKCAHVFNARENLKSAAGDLPLPAPAPEPPAAPTVSAEPPVPAEPPISAAPPEPPAQPGPLEAPAVEETPEPQHEDALSIFEAAIAANSPVHESAEAEEAAPAIESSAEAAPQETPAATEAEAPVEDTLPPAPEKPKRRLGWLWALGSALMLAVFIVQGLYLFRTPLAVTYPAMKPLLVNLCGALNCKVALPRTQDGEVLGIAGSDLQTDPANPNVLTLNAVLRNRAPHPYEYPLLEVTLTDAADRPVLQRVLQPAEYLPKGTNPAAGVPPKSETSIKLNLGVTDVAPMGFRLYLFYPLP